jgi:hypothetical protein
MQEKLQNMQIAQCDACVKKMCSICSQSLLTPNKYNARFLVPLKKEIRGIMQQRKGKFIRGFGAKELLDDRGEPRLTIIALGVYGTESRS